MFMGQDCRWHNKRLMILGYVGRDQIWGLLWVHEDQNKFGCLVGSLFGCLFRYNCIGCTFGCVCEGVNRVNLISMNHTFDRRCIHMLESHSLSVHTWRFWAKIVFSHFFLFFKRTSSWHDFRDRSSFSSWWYFTKFFNTQLDNEKDWG